MSLYALSDLHLSFAADKSMEVFHGWEHYTERIEANWKRLITDQDTVVLAGDTSWALKLEEAKADLEFINKLPGQKIILKGNHDYWWNTVTKMERFLGENGFDSLHILHNNYFTVGNIAVCGTRGWLYDGSGEEDEKVIARECGRLESSLQQAVASGLERVVFLHYPPAYGDFVNAGICDILQKYEVRRVYYGHIHGVGKKTVAARGTTAMRLISCDCVDFTPVFVG